MVFFPGDFLPILQYFFLIFQNGKFAVLEHQMDPSSNFLSYRSTLRAAISRSEGATDQRQRIVIPFFSLLVKDLFVVNEGTASRLPNGHINFCKAKQLSEKLKEFALWKDVECPYSKIANVTEFLQFSPSWSENGKTNFVQFSMIFSKKF